MSRARRDDQSCFEPELREVDEKDPDNTSRDADRIRSRSLRASGKGDEPGSSDIVLCQQKLRKNSESAMS